MTDGGEVLIDGCIQAASLFIVVGILSRIYVQISKDLFDLLYKDPTKNQKS